MRKFHIAITVLMIATWIEVVVYAFILNAWLPTVLSFCAGVIISFAYLLTTKWGMRVMIGKVEEPKEKPIEYVALDESWGECTKIANECEYERILEELKK